MTVNAILEFKNVKKNYGKKNIISELNFTVSKNEIIVLLGVNGAGKTTTIKMMLGLETPSAGSISLFGLNPTNPESRKSVGITPQNLEFPEGIKTFEILYFIHSHYPNPKPVKEMIKKFELSSFLHQKATKLSGGQKRRLALALAFIGDPQIVCLDEPTTGLDVGSRKILLEAIKEYSKNGNTVFLTTHYLDEIENIATRIIFLQDGKIIADDTVAAIKSLANSTRATIVFYASTHLDFATYRHVVSFEVEESKYTLQTHNADALIYELVNNKVPFKNLNIIKESLESAFINLSKGNTL